MSLAIFGTPLVDKLRLQKFDHTHEGHTYLKPDDHCYFLYEYTSNKDYSFSHTNQLIHNLKKSPLKKDRAEYRYKGIAIKQIAGLFDAALDQTWLSGATLVPVPPSKASDHPEYDDRMLQICRLMHSGRADVREIIRQKRSMDAGHTTGNRPSVEDLINCYTIDEKLCVPVPKSIVVVDDVLTLGTHFRAMHTVLSRKFPSTLIIGLFVARRILPEVDYAAMFEDLEPF